LVRKSAAHSSELSFGHQLVNTARSLPPHLSGDNALRIMAKTRLLSYSILPDDAPLLLWLSYRRALLPGLSLSLSLSLFTTVSSKKIEMGNLNFD
jgi:hypothetical protein